MNTYFNSVISSVFTVAVILVVSFFTNVLNAYTEYFVVVNQPLQMSTASTLSNGAITGFASHVIDGVRMFRAKGDAFNGYRVRASALRSDSFEHVLQANWTYLIRFKNGQEQAFIEQIKQLDSLVYMQPNYIYTNQVATDEPYYEDYQESAMSFMNFDSVWDVSTGNGVIVAVLDSGLLLSHEEFCSNGAGGCNDWSDLSSTNLVTPYDAVDNVDTSWFQSEIDGEDYDTIDSEPDDLSGHGTHVAGIIGALDNNSGGVGAAYGASIMPVRVMYAYCCDSNGADASAGSVANIVTGINFAVTNNADIINLSLGAMLIPGSDEDQIFQAAVDSALAEGVLVVSAAGNSSLDVDSNYIAPAGYSSSMAVSSVDDVGDTSSFTNFGDSIDVAAVGSAVYAPYIGSNNSTYALLSGTSMASPFVAALGAIIMSYDSTLSASEVWRLIQISASRSSSEKSTYLGYGVIDAQRALFLAGNNELNNDAVEATALMGSTGQYSDLVCYPNPLDLSEFSNTDCVYYLNQESLVDTYVYSRRGELLHRSSTTLSAGKQTLAWYGTDQVGRQVPNGVYQFIVSASPTDGSDSETLKHLITVYE